MSVSLMTADEALGLFELDATGKVLYYRLEPGGQTSPAMVGRNFYDDVARFENVDEFRRCLTEFERSMTVTDSFDFDCRYGGSAQRVKVLVARIYDTANQNHTKSILVYLKRK